MCQIYIYVHILEVYIRIDSNIAQSCVTTSGHYKFPSHLVRYTPNQCGHEEQRHLLIYSYTLPKGTQKHYHQCIHTSNNNHILGSLHSIMYICFVVNVLSIYVHSDGKDALHANLAKALSKNTFDTILSLSHST